MINQSIFGAIVFALSGLMLFFCSINLAQSVNLRKNGGVLLVLSAILSAVLMFVASIVLMGWL